MEEERKRHSLETKLAVVKAVVEDGKSHIAVSDEMQIAQSLVSLWVRRFKNGEPLTQRGPESKEAKRQAPKRRGNGTPKAQPKAAFVAPMQLAPRPSAPSEPRVATGNILHELETLKAENVRLKRKVQQLLGLVMEE